MTIKGFDPLSTIDDPAGLSLVLFTGGCNLRCPYCYNRSLVDEMGEEYPRDEILRIIESRRKYISSAVICGGEPTVGNVRQLKQTIIDVRKFGYRIKLDTNGIFFANLASILKDNLVDYVAMDIKAALTSYTELLAPALRGKMTPHKVRENLLWSVSILHENVQSGMLHDYELRTTCVKPFVSVEMFQSVIEDIRGILPAGTQIPNWYLQPAKLDTAVMIPDYEMEAATKEDMAAYLEVLQSSGLVNNAKIR